MGIKYCPEVKARMDMYKQKITELRKINDDAKLCKKLFPETHFWVDYEINYNFNAKSMDEVKNMLKIFAKNGVMLNKFTESDVHPEWVLNGKFGTKIRVAPYWTTDEAGATCRLVQVGSNTRTYEEPIYKLMCDGKESAPKE